MPGAICRTLPGNGGPWALLSAGKKDPFLILLPILPRHRGLDGLVRLEGFSSTFHVPGTLYWTC